jgi:DNA-binding response OmpR family regulator
VSAAYDPAAQLWADDRERRALALRGPVHARTIAALGAEVEARLADLKRELGFERDAAATARLCAAVGLTNGQAALLRAICAHDHLATKRAIYAALYGDRLAQPDDKVIDVMLVRVRKALAKAGAPGAVETIWGQGLRAQPALRAWIAAIEAGHG